MKGLYFKVVAILLGLFLGMIRVNAQAVISYVGDNEATIGDTFTLRVKVSDVEDLPIIGIGGYLIINQDYLEVISLKGMEEPYQVHFNQKELIFSGLSYEARGIEKEAFILEITLKALKTGNTKLTFREAELSDYDAKIVPVVEKEFELNIKEQEVMKDTISTSTDLIQTKNPKIDFNETKDALKETVTNKEITNKTIKNNSKVTSKENIIKTNTLEKNEQKEASITKINNLFKHFKTVTTRKSSNKENMTIKENIKNFFINIFKK